MMRAILRTADSRTAETLTFGNSAPLTPSPRCSESSNRHTRTPECKNGAHSAPNHQIAKSPNRQIERRLVEHAPATRPCIAAALLLTFTAACLAQDTIVGSPHDLSVFGPGPIRATQQDQVCIFCHTPHNARPDAPLWNRHNPTTHYRIYDSSTTDARIDQPGPESKMCLSCHDGSVAIGMVLSQPPTDPIHMNQPFMPTGPSNLTNDLSDDHPIGLRYDRALANQDPQLRDPGLVSREIALGERGELECTACHDAHNNEFGDFLRIPQREGALCNTCHAMQGWRASDHAHSPATVPAALTGGQRLELRSMADNACASCHVPHGAPERERLLRASSYQLCIACHDGLTASDITRVLNLRSGHTPTSAGALARPLSGGASVGALARPHDPAENPLTMRPHVDCVDCHNPHAVRSQPGVDLLSGPTRSGDALVPPEMFGVGGVSIGGLPIDDARFYYEVCFRCHADNPAPIRNRIARQVDTAGNVRRQALPTVASAHPIATPARNTADSPSLRPEFRDGAMLSCQDCHNNPDAAERGGGGPDGPHGSPYPFLLAANYETGDFVNESPRAYALCYECHDRTSILADESFEFHNLHVVRGRSSCSACHAPHGVPGSRTNHSHLINFDLSVVSGERLFVDRGQRAGSCTLTCHGVRHVNFVYGLAAP